MKRTIAVMGLLWLLSSCTSRTPQRAATREGCPQPPATLSAPTPPDNNPVFDRFDYRPRNVVADANTVRFQTRFYDFVFCRGDRTWTVHPSTLPPELLPAQNYAEQVSTRTAYQQLDVNGRTYQYRVVLDTDPQPPAVNPAPASPSSATASPTPDVSPSPDSSPSPEASVTPTPAASPSPQPPANSAPPTNSASSQKVVFELVSANGQAPKRYTLYTLKAVQQAGIGDRLGIPQITATAVHGDRLWWAVASSQEQGENGLATLVGYHPQTDQITVIQPRELKGQQIVNLAIAGTPSYPTFWLATAAGGSADAASPGMGLVAYRPELRNPSLGTVTAYNINNSPLAGAIPTELQLDGEHLWVATGNGVCQLQWQAAHQPENWACWRFAAIAKMPIVGLPLYRTLVDNIATLSVKPRTSDETIEVLWWMPIGIQVGKGRYEVRSAESFTVTIDQGAQLWSETLAPNAPSPAYWSAVNWPGLAWHWNGDRFVRGFDEVRGSFSGRDAQGISVDPRSYNGLINWNVIRGDLELVDISPSSTTVKYYSGWADDGLLKPYPTVISQGPPANPQPNPLDLVVNQLQSP